MTTHETSNLRAVSFLRYLYGELNSDFKTIAINEKAKEYEIPNFNVFCLVLSENEILLKRRVSNKFQYRWNKEFNPNEELVQKIREWMGAYNKSCGIKPAAMGKSLPQVIKEQVIMEIKPTNTGKEQNIFTKFIAEMKAAGVKGTINLTIEI